MDCAALTSLLNTVFPEVFDGEAATFKILSVQENEAVIRLTADERHLRPGGTVSGPTLMTLADVAMYVVILAHSGPQTLAVTSNLSINFLRKPQAGILFGTARLLKLGRKLAVGDVLITSEHEPDKPVAHASVTYSLPQKSV